MAFYSHSDDLHTHTLHTFKLYTVVSKAAARECKLGVSGNPPLSGNPLPSGNLLLYLTPVGSCIKSRCDQVVLQYAHDQWSSVTSPGLLS